MSQRDRENDALAEHDAIMAERDRTSRHHDDPLPASVADDINSDAGQWGDYTSYELMARGFFRLDPSMEPSGFVNKFFECCSVADHHNFERLRESFPELCNAFEKAREG